MGRIDLQFLAHGTNEQQTDPTVPAPGASLLLNQTHMLRLPPRVTVLMASPRIEDQNVMNARTILLVEDNQVVLRALQYKLQRAGYEVVCSEAPSAAVAAARTVNPDLYILDINFPPEPGSHWTGFTMAEWLHHIHVGDERPIIFITADDIQKHMHEAAQVGAVAILPKPLDIDQLLATVAYYLNPEEAAA